MSFRDKIKKAFKANSPPTTKHASPAAGPPHVSRVEEEARWPSNVYRPGEPLPRLKYRAPVKKEHKEKLDSFKFDDAWRRRSQASLHSPMGSRMPSRRGSRIARKSLSGPPARESLELRRKSLIQATRVHLQTQLDSEADSHPEVMDVDMVRSSAAIVTQSSTSPVVELPRHACHSVRASKTIDENKVGDEDTATGAVTSTMTIMVPGRSARLVYHVSTTRRPQPVSTSHREISTGNTPAAGTTNPSTTEDLVAFGMDRAHTRQYINVPTRDHTLALSPTSATHKELSAMTLSPTTTSPSAHRTTFYAANTARNRKSLMGSTTDVTRCTKRPSTTARPNRTSPSPGPGAGAEHKSTATTSSIAVEIRAVDDTDDDLFDTQAPAPVHGLATATLENLYRTQSPITDEVQANIAQLRKCRRLPRNKRVSVRPVSTGPMITGSMSTGLFV